MQLMKKNDPESDLLTRISQFLFSVYVFASVHEHVEMLIQYSARSNLIFSSSPKSPCA